MASHSPPSIREIILQTKPFQSRSQEAVVGIYLAADRLRRHFQCAVKAYGISLQQYNVLRILRGAGADGMPTLSIPERMIERTPGITRLLDRLEARDLVERIRCEEDRRLVRVHITSEGLALLERLEGPLGKADHDALKMLTDDEQVELVRLLEVILAAT